MSGKGEKMQIKGTVEGFTPNSNISERMSPNNMGKDEFMQILVAQLQNQDPLSPMENEDFVAQMAQFSTLEQIQSMNEISSFAHATALVGKRIYSEITDSNGIRKEVSGLVERAMTIGGVPHIQVNGHYIPYSSNIVVEKNSIT